MTDSARRMSSLAILATVLLLALMVRVSFLGTVESKSLRREGERTLKDVNPLPATRGRIFARDGRVLVDNLDVNVVLLDTTLIKKKQQRVAVIGRLASLLDIPYSTIENQLIDPRNPRYEPARVATGAKESAVLFIKEHPELFPGVTTDITWQRVYPYGRLASHVLGYLGRVTPDDIRSRPADLRYQNSDLIGRAGIEKSFERELRGIPGEQIVTKDPSGRVVERTLVREPVAGKDVRLTIDVGLQRLAESTLAQGLPAARLNSFKPLRSAAEPIKAEAGALVCMNVNTGEVVASASYPDYDPREFGRGLSLKREAEYQSPDAHAPLINRVIEGLYPPGSTFKLFTSIAALRYNIITTNTTYNDQGVFEVPSLKAKKVKFQWKNAGTPPSQFGVIDLRNAIRVSADTFFYKIGFDFHANSPYENGIQVVAREMGLGQFTNVRLPQEAKGVIPDRARQTKLHERFPSKFRKEWPIGATINVSIGQGDVLVTLLQLARGYAAFGNGGTVVDAKIVLETLDRAKTDKLLSDDSAATQSSTTTTIPPTTSTVATTIPVPAATAPAVTSTTAPTTTTTPKVKSILGVEVPVPPTFPPLDVEPAVEGHVDISDAARAAILGGLQDVVGKKGGTAVGAFQGFDLQRFPIAGKTGTAEKKNQQDYSLFVAFGPLPSPTYSCAAVIEEGGYGRQAGALIRRMFEGIAGFAIHPVRTVSEKGGAER